MSTGLNAIIGIKQESAFGTEATPPTVFEDMLSEDIKATGDAILTPKTCNGTRELRRVLPGGHRSGGSIKMLANPEGILPWMLKGVFGGVVSSALGGGAYSHVFTPSNSTTPTPFTLYIDRLAGVFNYIGAVISGIEWTGAVDKEVEVSASILSQKPKSISRVSSTINDVRPFIWSDAAVTFNSVSNTDVESLSLSIQQDIEMVATHNGTRFVKRATGKDFAVTGKLAFEFNDMTLLERLWGAIGATSPTNDILDTPLSITYTSPDQIGSSGQYYAITWNFPNVVLTAGEPVVSGPNDRIIQDIDFVYRYDGTNHVTCTLVNSQSGYPNP